MSFVKINHTAKSLTPCFKEIILARHLISKQDYKDCERRAKQCGQDIEEYLYKSGLIPHQKLQEAIATSQGAQVEFINIANENENKYLKFMPKLSLENGYNLIADYAGLNPMQADETSGIHGFSENDQNFNNRSKFITARDFRNLFISQNKHKLNHQAAHLLADNTPNLAAKFGMYISQKIILIVILSLVLYGFVAQPLTTFYGLGIGFSSLFLFGSSVKIYSLFLPNVKKQNTTQSHLKLDPATLPIYSILVPLFKEAKMIEQLSQHLLKLNYPRSKLDIKLLFEQEDIETIEAAKKLNLPECFEFIIVEKSQPQTKPKAMNFALPFVRGKFVTIYDAEDKPAPDQLLKAVEKFQQEDDNLACLQASLEYENWNENWIARHFFIEYATQFNRHLPALERLKIPLPLGGTSNHFKSHILRELGGWDAHNVTEDADLGIRLALYGYRSAVLNSTTLEEANYRLFPWLQQRTRWLKGWLQTIIVHSRHPTALLQAIGPFRFLGFLALMSGMVFSSLIHPFVLLLPFVIYFTFDFANIIDSTLHILIFLFSFFTFTIGYGAALLSNLQAIAEYKRWRLLPTLISAPIYWLMISVAAYNAIYEYFRRPFYWAKTEHGKSKHLNHKKKEKSQP